MRFDPYVQDDVPMAPEPLASTYWRAPRVKIVAVVLLIVSAAVLLGIGFEKQHAERDAIRQLPVAERRALYECTRARLASACDPAKGRPGLDEYCRRQADFLSQFSECDASCRALTGQFRPQPTR